MITGSCLCGNIQYEIVGDIGQMGHCHCRMCQKAHGAAFGTYADVRWDNFRLLSGAPRSYESSEGVQRTFCPDCGSTLQFVEEGSEEFGIAVATFDEDPGTLPCYEIWTSSKAPWLRRGENFLSHLTEPDRGDST